MGLVKSFWTVNSENNTHNRPRPYGTQVNHSQVPPDLGQHTYSFNE